jgi:hypothetical protein
VGTWHEEAGAGDLKQFCQPTGWPRSLLPRYTDENQENQENHKIRNQTSPLTGQCTISSTTRGSYTRNPIEFAVWYDPRMETTETIKCECGTEYLVTQRVNATVAAGTPFICEECRRTNQVFGTVVKVERVPS